MQSSKIPNLSGQDIELKAEEVIEFFDHDVLRRPTVTPIVSFVQTAAERFSFVFEARDLGVAPSGHKILGGFQQRPLAIFLDLSIAATNRAPFTLAHEFGHLVFHRNLVISKGDYAFRDTERDLATARKILRTPREWIEWQANRFASAILMPRLTFRTALTKTQRDMGILKNRGVVYVDEQPSSLKDLHTTLEALAVVYNVNKTNVRCRLSDLNLIIDHRDKDIEHISLLLQEEQELPALAF